MALQCAAQSESLLHWSVKAQPAQVPFGMKSHAQCDPARRAYGLPAPAGVYAANPAVLYDAVSGSAAAGCAPAPASRHVPTGSATTAVFTARPVRGSQLPTCVAQPDMMPW